MNFFVHSDHATYAFINFNTAFIFPSIFIHKTMFNQHRRKVLGNLSPHLSHSTVDYNNLDHPNSRTWNMSSSYPYSTNPTWFTLIDGKHCATLGRKAFTLSPLGEHKGEKPVRGIEMVWWNIRVWGKCASYYISINLSSSQEHLSTYK